jgi:serine phosphatase RsbU (regulator of sigma subunit)/anti-sigma regulatory factor (Ser/Thr protein kinase)/transposase
MMEDHTEHRTHSLRIPARESRLGEVRDFVTAICDEAGFDRRETANTKLAVDEACTNIIKHAYAGDSGEIEIRIQAEDGALRITILDHGQGFDWESVQTPDLHEYVEVGRKGGLGIFLMNRLMDGVHYESGEDVNRLVLVKSSRAAGARRFAFPRMPTWRHTLRMRHSLRASAIYFVGVLVTLFFLIRQQTAEIHAQRQETWLQVRMIARQLSHESVNLLVKADPYSVERATVTATITRLLQDHSAVRYATVVGRDSTVYADSRVERIFQTYQGVPGVRLSDEDDGGIWVRFASEGGEVLRDLAVPVGVRDIEGGAWHRLGEVHLGISEGMVEASIEDPRPITVLYMTVAYLVGSVVIFFMVNVLVKPIQSLTEGIRKIGEGSLEGRIDVSGPAEINAIAEAFNEITAKFRHAQSQVVEQERLQKEMQVAQEIQQSLLPKHHPEVTGYDLGTMYRAAKEVGGDYFDFIQVDDDALGIVVADVSGKGVPGSLVMTMIRTALRMEARGNLSARDVVARMNDFVTDDMKKGMFVTLFYVILDSRNRVISYASAGHNPMILYRSEMNETYFLNPKGFPVGINVGDEEHFRRSMSVEKIRLKKDDMLLIYTDGITEAMNEKRELYGEDRLIDAIKRLGGLHPQEFVRELEKDIKDFTGGIPQHDDITVVAVKEKMMADEVLGDFRQKLIDMVEVEGLSIAEACRRMRVSPSTYYRYRRRLDLYGNRGLMNKMLRKDETLRRVSVEDRRLVLDLIRMDPSLGATRIAREINRTKPPESRLTPKLVYEELRRLKLNNESLRTEYLRRTGRLSSGAQPGAETPAPAASPQALRDEELGGEGPGETDVAPAGVGAGGPPREDPRGGEDPEGAA